MNGREEIFKIRIIKEPITFEELKKIAEERYGDMVKAVVDVEKEIMALGGDLHSDEEVFLLENGSLQENLWGINLWVEKPFEEMIEFDSIINIRPKQGNRSRFIEDENIRNKIKEIIKKLIKNV
jgi:maltose-binding protein MalE